jgi:hypothetical protein
MERFFGACHGATAEGLLSFFRFLRGNSLIKDFLAAGHTTYNQGLWQSHLNA